MNRNGIYIAGGEQHAGKTFLTLGLLSALSRRLPRGASYFKPVGQKETMVDGQSIGMDSYFINNILDLGMDLDDSAPFSTGAGAAKQFLTTGEPRHIVRRIQRSYLNMQRVSDYLVVEGTGHPGVGSVFGVSNGEVARRLRLPVIMVLDGGIGSTIDRYTLCSSVFKNARARIIGVVINKIIPEKMEVIRETVVPWFQRRGLKIYGTIPYQRSISQPSLKCLTTDLHLNAQYENESIREVSGFIPAGGRVDEVYGDLVKHSSSALILSCRRVSLIEMIITRRVAGDLQRAPGALILCGCEKVDGWILNACRQVGLPLYTIQNPFPRVVQKLNRKIFKVTTEETLKVREIIKLVESHVDIERIFNDTLSRAGEPRAAGGTGSRIPGLFQRSLQKLKKYFSLR